MKFAKRRKEASDAVDSRHISLVSFDCERLAAVVNCMLYILFRRKKHARMRHVTLQLQF